MKKNFLKFWVAKTLIALAIVLFLPTFASPMLVAPNGTIVPNFRVIDLLLKSSGLIFGLVHLLIYFIIIYIIISAIFQLGEKIVRKNQS